MKKRSCQGGCAEYREWAPHRREFLRVGGLSALGLTLPTLYSAQARASNYGETGGKARAKSCILVFLAGGPSQFETFDPRPEAKSDYRCIFDVIPTKAPAIQLCEHLPDLAKVADRFALIRSAWHNYGGHFGGHRYALTGHAAPGNVDQDARPDDRPGVVSLAGRHFVRRGEVMPAVMLPWVSTDQGGGASGGMGGGVLGKQFDPVHIEVDAKEMERNAKTAPVFRVPAFSLQTGVTTERLENRRSLLSAIEGQRVEMAQAANTKNLDGLYRKAYDLLTSPKIKEGFDLDQEARALRDRYGVNAFGQSCLMARRLVERGARFVQVNFARYVTQKGYGWDTHDKGKQTLQEYLLPRLNAGLGTLLADLAERSLLDDTLVVAMGEFGRTPRVKTDGGRDHWSKCYSLLLAGGGIKGGYVLGRSDKTGAYPASDPVESREILVTILTLLGIPTATTDPQGRVAPIFEGAHPIDKLLA